MANRVAITLKPSGDHQFNNTVNHVATWFKNKNIDFCFLEKEGERLKAIIPDASYSLISKKDLSNNKFILTLGGDGTLIGTCRKMLSSTPILGVNYGKLGFITEFSGHEMFDALERVLKDDFTTKSVQMFHVEVSRDNKKIFESRFVNDAVLSKNNIARLFELSVESDNSPVFNVAGDGLIISSPLGSTAYSLAAGGPIVHPGVGGLTLTPICPHGLTHRPLIIPDEKSMNIQLLDNQKDVCLTVDGQVTCDITSKDIITIKKNLKDKVEFIINPDKDYFLTLKEKFYLSRRAN